MTCAVIARICPVSRSADTRLAASSVCASACAPIAARKNAILALNGRRRLAVEERRR